MEKEMLIKKIEEGLSIRELSLYFNKSFTSIRYWIKKFNLKTHGYPKTDIKDILIGYLQG
jgi:transposase